MRSKKINHISLKQISKIIFIDGFPRSGKSVLSGIIPCFDGVENIKFLTILEHILPGLRFKSIKKDFAKSLITTYLNEYCYESYIGRNLNFRKNEQSSIYEYYKPREYRDRLKIPDGSKAVKKISKKQTTFLFQTHDVISNYKYFEDLKLDCKIIELVRNPIDVSYSWYKRGWGKRFLKDKQSFSSLIEKKKICAPWYSYSQTELWSNLNSVEKCVYNVLTLCKLSFPHYGKLKKKNKKVLIIKFENFVQKPKKEILKIQSFLKKNYSKKIFLKLKKAKCPRKLNIGNYEMKKNFLKKNINKDLYKKLIYFEKKYNEI